jgi:DNA-binding XRE family transcriptional regulator
MPRSLPGRVKRKRARLFGTQAECGKALGVSRSTIQRLESRPLPDDLMRYLDLLGYNVGFYPVRKGGE